MTATDEKIGKKKSLLKIEYYVWSILNILNITPAIYCNYTVAKWDALLLHSSMVHGVSLRLLKRFPWFIRASPGFYSFLLQELTRRQIGYINWPLNGCVHRALKRTGVQPKECDLHDFDHGMLVDVQGVGLFEYLKICWPPGIFTHGSL